MPPECATTAALVLLGSTGVEPMPVVLRIGATGAACGVEFVEPCVFTPQVREHIRTVVVPTAWTVARSRGVSPRGVSLSVSLPTSVQLHDEHIACDGYSADVAVAVAVIGCALGIPLADDVALTGQLTDDTGRIAMVRGLDAKLRIIDPLIGTVLVPDWPNDPYFRQTYPAEYVSVRTQIKASERIIYVVRTVEEAFVRSVKRENRKNTSPVTTQHSEASVAESIVTPSPQSVGEPWVSQARTLLGQLDERTLARAVDVPIDEKLLTFSYPLGALSDAPSLLEALSRLVIHLGLVRADDETLASVEAARVISLAYRDNDAVSQALRDAQQGTRVVFDRVVQALKQERREMQVRAILLRAIDPMDAQARLLLVQALIEGTGRVLADQDGIAPAQQLANDPHLLVHTLVGLQSSLPRTFPR